MTMFHVGMKVVCVDAGPAERLGSIGNCWTGDEAPIEGKVYTVRRVFNDIEGALVVWLDEIKRSQRAIGLYGDQIGYSARRFRPVVERKTSISIFTEILDRANKRQSEKVG